MVEAFGARWTIEQWYEEGKGEAGLDEYEIRSWHGWLRHITLSMVALAFLAALRAIGEEVVLKKKSEQATQVPEATDSLPSQMPSDLSVMVPLSVAEIRRLFFRLVSKPPLSFAYHLAWSFWRRTHQALARLCHYKRRCVLANHLQL